MAELRDGKGEWEGKGFYTMAAKHMDNELAKTIWSKLEDFAKYSFNKSHAVAYGTIAFRTLYAKYYAPAEFIMACIRTNPDDAHAYVSEGRRLGVYIRPPDIKHSGSEVEVNGSDIYFGFSNIKGVGRATADYIVSLVNRYSVDSVDSLTRGLELEQADWEKRKKAAKESDNPYPTQFNERSPKSQLRSNIITLLERVGAFDQYTEREVTLTEVQEAEKELLGIILSDNVEESFAANSDLIAECNSYEELMEVDTDNIGRYARLPGTIIAVRKTKTKATGAEMGIVSIEYGENRVEFAVFPQQWKAYKWLWEERTPGIFRLKKTDRGISFEEGMKLG